MVSFLSTPSARRATGREVEHTLRRVISIHALREEGDPQCSYRAQQRQHISIHALREEGDSTATMPRRTRTDFYPRPPRGGRPWMDPLSIIIGEFLSTPSARRATLTSAITAGSTRFLSTPSARRATAKTETKSLFSNKLYNILHEFRRALIYNGSKSYPNHAK